MRAGAEHHTSNIVVWYSTTKQWYGYELNFLLGGKGGYGSNEMIAATHQSLKQQVTVESLLFARNGLVELARSLCDDASGTEAA